MSINLGEGMTEDARAIAQQDIGHNLEDASFRVKAQMELALGVLKGLTICNGGAIIAMFTFVGNSSELAKHADRSLVAWGFGVFVTGLVLTLAVYILGYVIQGYYLSASLQEAWNRQNQIMSLPPQYDDRKPYNAGTRVEFAAITCAALALLCFATGAAVTLVAVL